MNKHKETLEKKLTSLVFNILKAYNNGQLGAMKVSEKTAKKKARQYTTTWFCWSLRTWWLPTEPDREPSPLYFSLLNAGPKLNSESTGPTASSFQERKMNSLPTPKTFSTPSGSSEFIFAAVSAISSIWLETVDTRARLLTVAIVVRILAIREERVAIPLPVKS